MTIDKRQEHYINILFTIVSIVAAGATISWVYHERKHHKLEMEIFAMEKKIKTHELNKIRNEE